MTGSRRAIRAVRLVLALLAALPVVLQAGERVVTFDSDPPGAGVYQLKGFKREPLGDTPLTHRFAAPGEHTMVRVAIDRRGYAPKTLELGPGKREVFVKLEPLPLVAPATDYADRRRTSLALAAERAFDGIRDPLLATIEPWSLNRPAAIDSRDGLGLLRFDLQRPRGRFRPGDLESVADRLAELLSRTSRPGGLDAVLLSFGREDFGGVRSTVGTRQETEMACEGGMAPASVWDHCATRSVTTSTTSYGTSTQYRCVGGTVTRQVYNPCLRRVPRQKTVVDIDNDTTPRSRRDVHRQLIVWDDTGARRVGGCADGDAAGDPAGADGRLLGAICRPGTGAR